jgi:hypothetical protein
MSNYKNVFFKKSELNRKRNKKKEDILLKYLKDVKECQDYWYNKRS